VTAVLDTTADASVTDAAPGHPLASWPARAGAFAVDVLLPVAVMATVALVTSNWIWWMSAFLVVAGVTAVVLAVTRWLVPALTGWTLGRALFGIAVRRPDGSPPGIFRLALRELAHLLDTAALFIGWLWPLWDRRRRTFADLLLRTEVHIVERPRRNVRRLTAVVLVAAAVVSAVAVAVSYLMVYRHDRAVATAREQIAEEGPRIVEKMFSYRKDTLQQDFSHAQSLTTEGYRPQLISQQQIAQEGGGATTELWAVSSAVLPASPETADHSSMLVALQGQRGENPDDLKFISATLRVDFEKSNDGQWRVANIIVLKQPNMNAAGQ
jgi:Mce-associated membrane protein